MGLFKRGLILYYEGTERRHCYILLSWNKLRWQVEKMLIYSGSKGIQAQYMFKACCTILRPYLVKTTTPLIRPHFRAPKAVVLTGFHCIQHTEYAL